MLKLTARQTACALDCLRADRIVGWRPLTPTDELVWRTLYFTFMNKSTGACWPALKTIAAAAGCCRRTVSASIKRLRTAGWLRWYRKRKHRAGNFWTQAPNDYELVVPRRWRRTVSECKACARTTRLFIHIAAGHLMRPKKVVAPVKIVTPVPPGYGSNWIPADCDPGVAASLARFAKTFEDRETKRVTLETNQV